MLLTRQLLFRFVRTDIQQQYLPRFPFQIRVRIDYVTLRDFFLPTTFLPFEIERKLSRFTRSAVRFATMPVNYFEFVNISGGEFDWPIETKAS